MSRKRHPHLRTRHAEPARDPALNCAPRVSEKAVLPLGALMLAASVSSWAQSQPTGASAPEATLGTVTVQESAQGAAPVQNKDTIKPGKVTIGKGTQDIKDIPQSVTVFTEKLMSERNQDDLREVLRTTAGVTFQAGETGEEDVRLRGFSLGQAGDIYVDGMRDAPLYERDTFNLDRVEVLKGSASMLFGKGSTGGVVNQVNKRPLLLDQKEVSYTAGTGGFHRATGDFNVVTGENAALRINAMVNNNDNYGAFQRKRGIAPSFAWGIDTHDEFSISAYYLDIKGRPNYNHPWLTADGKIIPTLPAKNFYGLNGDHLNTSAQYATLGHIHRFDDGGEINTRLRAGKYDRDLLASTISFGNPRPNTLGDITDNTVLTRGSKGRIGNSNLVQLQSDYNNTFYWGGKTNEVLTGLDFYHDSADRNNNVANPAPRPNTTVGTPDDGAWVPDTRGPIAYNHFQSQDLGLYFQDTLFVTKTLKLVGGLRYDHFKASYHDAAGDLTNQRGDNLWSPRVGLIFQPDAISSYYVSYGSSYNTSGDTYQYGINVNAATGRTARTPPEKSRNFEIGGKWDLFERRAFAGLALFYSEKYNERNTDPDSTATQELLSGKRHATGMEFNLSGSITPRWEVMWNHTWIPSARIDRSNVVPNAAGTGAQVQGDRPGLTPRHSGSLWTTYTVLPKLRIGGGLNYRSAQSPDGARQVQAPGFTTIDAMAEYAFDAKTTAQLNVTNLTNKLYADTLYRGFYQPGAPRAVQVSLKARF